MFRLKSVKVRGLLTWVVLAGLTIVLAGTPGPAQAWPWRLVGCAYATSLALAPNGDLYATGNNVGGKLGFRRGRNSLDPSSLYQTSWKRVMRRVKYAVSGDIHTIALKANGTVWVSGWNIFGQLGTSRRLGESIPRWQRQRSLRNIVDIAAGAGASYALDRNGIVWVTGVSPVGDTPIGVPSPQSYSVHWIRLIENVARMWGATPGSNEIFVEKLDGTVWQLGAKQWGLHPVQNVVFIGENWVLNQSGQLYPIADFDADAPADYVPYPPAQTPIVSGVSDFQIQADDNLALLDTAGILKVPPSGWRDFTPLRTLAFDWVPVLSSVREFCLSDHHALAVKTDGSLWGAGNNDSGQFGYPNISGTDSIESWVQIAP